MTQRRRRTGLSATPPGHRPTRSGPNTDFARMQMQEQTVIGGNGHAASWLRHELSSGEPGDLNVILPLMRCPIDDLSLTWDRATGELRDGVHSYPIRSGIPFLFAPRPAP